MEIDPLSQFSGIKPLHLVEHDEFLSFEDLFSNCRILLGEAQKVVKNLNFELFTNNNEEYKKGVGQVENLLIDIGAFFETIKDRVAIRSDDSKGKEVKKGGLFGFLKKEENKQGSPNEDLQLISRIRGIEAAIQKVQDFMEVVPSQLREQARDAKYEKDLEYKAMKNILVKLHDVQTGGLHGMLMYVTKNDSTQERNYLYGNSGLFTLQSIKPGLSTDEKDAYKVINKEVAITTIKNEINVRFPIAQ